MNPPGSLATLDDWLRWLETLAPRAIELGLDRVTDVLERLALPRPGRVITVAGTNGKGSSVAMLEALYRESGARVGSYTSPHVLDYGERIRIDGQPAVERSIITALERVESVREGVALTYFEYGTLAALGEFAAVGVDTIILEVGLGGRLDAVNAMDPDACLITNVSLDHCDWLGDDIETIAAEKAGVMRASRPAVFGSTDVPGAIGAAAARIGADLIVAGRDFGRSRRYGDLWDWRGRERSLDRLRAPALGGDHQIDNAAAVLALVEALGPAALLDRERVNRALGGVTLPGRLQRVVARGRRWLLDGAHNPAGAAALGAALATHATSGKVIAIVGILDDKDSGAIIAALAPTVDHWIACAAESTRAIAEHELADQVAMHTGRPCRIAGSVVDAMRAAAALATSEDWILVAGSFYTVGPALRWLGAGDDSLA